jgi:hypothetical protein
VQRLSDAHPDVRVQEAQGQPQVHYERAEPKVVVNQAQGQPEVRVEQAGRDQAGADRGAPPAPQANASQATGAAAGQAGGQPVPVSRLLDMRVTNAKGDTLGDVEHVLAGGADGKPRVVIGHGGFLGLGEKQVALPLDSMVLDGDRLVMRGLSDDQIRAMPAWDGKGHGYRDLDRDQTLEVARSG